MTPPAESASPSVFVSASAALYGSNTVASEVVDREFSMPEGKLRERAGIESVARAAAGETELTLGAQAARRVLQGAECAAREVDWIIATSETHHDYPSLGAQLHSRLPARETCGVLDVGGGCLGLLNALAAAQALLAAGPARRVLVVTADVHSRILTPERVAGEFGGLFGDGASAFVLERHGAAGNGYRLGEFQFGCIGRYAAAVQVARGDPSGLDVRFEGEALSRAAVSRMEKILTEVELRSGFPRAEAAAFATHQPNPRLTALLARQLGVPAEKFPPIAKTRGNLGSTTCAAALHAALEAQARVKAAERRPIFLASLGPGLLWGGGWLAPGRGG